MPDITFSSFAGGEVAPAYRGRNDQESHVVSAKQLLNVIASQTGPAIGRGGTMFVAGVKDNGDRVLLLPFQVNEENAYVLEFGDFYMRAYANRARLMESALAITAATAANPVVLTVNHNLPAGRTVYIAGVVGMTQLNGNYYLTDHVLASGKNISAAARTDPVKLTLAASHGFVGGELVFVESVGGMTQINDRSFTLRSVTDQVLSILAASKANPAVITVSGGHNLVDGDTVLIENIVGMTQLNNRRFVTSPHYSATKSVSAVTKANPGVVTTSANHGFDVGDIVRLESLGGMTELNNREFTTGRSLQAAKAMSFVSRGTGDKLRITTSTAHGYSTGDRVAFSSVGYEVELNNNDYTVTVINTTEFDLDGTDYDQFTHGPEGA